MTQLERADLHAAIELRYPDNTTEDITPKDLRDGLHELVDSVFVTATDTGAVPNAPFYQAGTTYQVGYLVRFLPAGGQVSFYSALRAGQLPAPVAVGDVNWKQMPPPVPATALSQSLTLTQARNINGDTVVLGRDYVIELPQPSLSGHQQLLSLAGIAEGWFSSEGYLVVNNVRTPIYDVDLYAQPAPSWNVKQYSAGYTDAQARAAQLNRVAAAGTTSVTLTAEAPFDYGAAASGTFAVNAFGCAVGKVARFAVGAGASAPTFNNAPAGQPFKYLGAAYVSGRAFSYSLLVCADRIEVITLED